NLGPRASAPAKPLRQAGSASPCSATRAGRACAARRRSAGSPNLGSRVQSAARAAGCDHRRADGRSFDAIASTYDARAPDASAEASVAAQPVRGGGGAGAVGRAPQATRDQLAAGGVVAVAVRARPAGAATRVTRGLWRTRCAGP